MPYENGHPFPVYLATPKPCVPFPFSCSPSYLSQLTCDVWWPRSLPLILDEYLWNARLTEFSVPNTVLELFQRMISFKPYSKYMSSPLPDKDTCSEMVTDSLKVTEGRRDSTPGGPQQMGGD